MAYEHTQHGKVHWLLYIAGVAGLAGIGSGMLAKPPAPIIVGSVAALAVISLVLAVAASMHWLRVRELGDDLEVRFGPLPIFGTRIAYRDITDAAPDRTTIFDCCGVHWGPGRGWTFAVRGFRCVRLSLGRKTVRIGTDDVDGLLAHLRSRMSKPA